MSVLLVTGLGNEIKRLGFITGPPKKNLKWPRLDRRCAPLESATPGRFGDETLGAWRLSVPPGLYGGFNGY